MKTLLKRIKLKLSLVAATCLGSIVSLGLLAPVSYVDAGWWDTAKGTVYSLLSWLIYLIFIKFMGMMATWATELLLLAASIDTFTSHPVIIEAWGVVRDLSNMFFIVILMFIAFGTLFRIENYSWKKLLPKMVMAAILVNFSRAIVGVVVDISQIIMLTFVEAIRPAATQGIVTAFQLDKLVRISAPAETSTDAEQADVEGAVLISIILAAVMLAVMVIVQCVYMVILIGRAAFIWFLTVLSPLAFTMMVLPATEKYFQTWWEMLGRYASVGPMLMFYLWLAMFIAAKTGGQLTESSIGDLEGIAPASSRGAATSGSTASDVVRDGSIIVSFTISTMMLLAGLKMAQDNASELGSVVSKASSVGKWVAMGGAGLLALKALRVPANAVNNGLQKRTGLDFNMVRNWGNLQQYRERRKQLNYAQGYGKAARRAEQGSTLGWLGASGYMYDNYAPVVGQQKGRKYAGLGGILFKQGRRQEEAEEYKVKEDGLNKLGQEIGTETAALEAEKAAERDKSTDARTQREALAANQERGDELHTVNNDGKSWDLRAGTIERELLQDYLADLRKKFDSETDINKQADIDAEMNRINGLLGAGEENGYKVGKDGKKKWVGVNVGIGAGAISGLMNNRRAALGAERTQWQGKAVISATPELLATAIASKFKERDDKLNELGDRKNQMSSELARLGPTIDFQKIATARSTIAEGQKELVSTNEDYLKSELIKQVSNGQILQALGTAEYMAKVGHSNELGPGLKPLIKDLLGENFYNNEFNMGPGAVKAMYEIAKKFGVDDQVALASIDQFANNAQNVNHWTMAQMVGVQAGKYYLRDKPTYEQAQRIEAEKVGANTIARNGNRLAVGYYDKDNVYHLAGNMVGLIAKRFHQFKDLVGKDMFNVNQGEHLAIYQDEFRELINAFHQDAGERAVAHKQFDLLINNAQSKKGAAGSYASDVSLQIDRANIVTDRWQAAS